MDKQRDLFVREIARMQDACRKTKSIHLLNDYGKSIKRMKKELAEYDKFKGRGTYDAGREDMCKRERRYKTAGSNAGERSHCHAG